MKSLVRHTFWFLSLAAMVTSMALVGCGSNGGDGTAQAPGTVGTTVAVTCPAGQVPTAYGCLYTATCQPIAPGYGWLPGENRCVPPTAPATPIASSGNFLAMNLQIFDKNTFSLMLQNSGLCSPYVVGANWGKANCENYSHAGYMSLQATGANGISLPTQAFVQIVAGSGSPNTPNNSWTTGGAKLPISFSSPLAFANGSAGFTGTGPNGFRFIVEKGLPGSPYPMSVDLQYNGILFARGNLIAQ